MRLLLTVLVLVVALAPLARADETVRQVQEELRKRNLYFGNIDGQTSPVLIDALKRYQARKGFAVTGKVDNDTATSLHIKAANVASTETLPDVPVLRSDMASNLPESQSRALQHDAEGKGGDLARTPPPPAESPSSAQDLTPERVNKFVEDYLRDAETHLARAENTDPANLHCDFPPPSRCGGGTTLEQPASMEGCWSLAAAGC